MEACPTRALTMTDDYEMADRDRGALIYDKDDLLAPLHEGEVPPPHAMREGLTAADYYRGEVDS